jgi:ApaG protein
MEINLMGPPASRRHLNFAIRAIVCADVNPFPEYSKLSAQANELAGLRVSVDDVAYVSTLDAPADRPHPFVYYITIHNDSETPVTIVGRKWIVREANGNCLVVEGDGVVGQRPRIEPGGNFSYNSYHVIAADAEVEGSYLGFDDAQRPLVVRIPKFSLNIPT